MSFKLKVELIDLQANVLLKEKHRENQLVKIYRCPSDDDFQNLKKFASCMALMFGTYACEQTFSKVKYVKSEHQTRLTDEYLKVILLFGCSTSKPNLDDILRDKRQFYGSH